jgi:fibronectin-binding autotransporter adhesin
MTTPADTGSGASGTAASANSVATSSTLSPAAGNCLAGFVVTPTGITVSSVSDGTNLYTLGTAANNASGARLTPFYANNVAGSGLTVTATLSGAAANAAIGVREYSGVGAIAGNRSLIDGPGSGTGNNAAPTASATPQQSGSLYVVGVGDLVGGVTYTAGGSVTRRLSVTSPIGLAIGEQVGSSTSVASLASAWTASGTVQWSEAVIVLRPAGTQAVASTNANAASGSGVGSFTLNLFNKPGDQILLAVQTTNASVTTSGIADTQGLTWTLLARAPNGSGGELSLWSAIGGSTASTATITLSGTGSARANSMLLPGIIASASLTDQIKTLTGSGTAISVTTDAPTVIASETSILFVGTPGQFTSYTNGGSASLNSAGNGAAGSIAIQSRLLASVGTVTETGTLGATQQWSVILVTLKTGGFAFDQSQPANTAGAASLAAAATFNVPPGSNRVLVVNVPGGASCTGVTDSQGNTWTVAERATNASNVEVSIWRTKNIVGGKLTVTAAFSASTKAAMLMYGFAGGDTTTWFDTGATTSGNGQTVSLTNPQPNYLLRLVVAAGGDGGTGRKYTSATPFAQPEGAISTNANLAVGLATVFEPGIVPTGTSTTLAIPGGANVQYVGAIADFKIAGSGAYTQGITTTNPGTGSDSGTGLLTHKGVGAATCTGSDTSIGKLTHAGVASASGTGSDAATGQLSHAGIATATGTGSTTGTGSLTHLAVASVFGTGSVTGIGLLTHPGVATSAGTGSDAASGRLTHAGVASASGAGTTSATGFLSHYGVTITNPGVGSTAATGRTIRAGVFVQLADFLETRVVVADFLETTVTVSDHLETSIAVRDGIDG